MNRLEYMSTLASLLQDVPEEERRDAMKYYNDYFDEAGSENEQEVIEELGDPEKVAKLIKADMKENEEARKSRGEYTETGYKDQRFEKREVPERRQPGSQQTGYQQSGYQQSGYQQTGYQQSEGQQKPPKTNRTLKIILIIAIVLIASPIIFPVAIGIIGIVLGIICAAFAVLFGLVVAMIAIGIAGISLFIVGLITLIPEIAVGLALTGIGLLLLVVGVVGTVVMIRLCIVAVPGIIRGITWTFGRLFHRKAVA